MPHECTTCGRSFPDGSKEMLSGCPDCGGTKFQFRPAGGSAPGDDAGDAPAVGDRPEQPPDPTDRQWPEHGDEPGHVRDSDGHDSNPDADDGDIIEADEEPIEADAQADARSGFVGPFGLSRDGDDGEGVADGENGFEPADPEPATARPERPPDDADDAPDRPPADRRAPGEDRPGDDQPGLSDLRRELNDQFESIKIVEPGQYELNLMELYDREEYVISLREDGKYVIEVPETWRGGPES